MYIHIVLPKTLTNKVANPQPTSRHCKSGLGAANVTWDGRITTAKMNMENGVFIFREGNILLMVQKSGDHQLRLVVSIPCVTGFFTSQVVQEFFHQQQFTRHVTWCFCMFLFLLLYLSHPPHIGMVYSFHLFPLMFILDQQQICIYHRTRDPSQLVSFPKTSQASPNVSKIGRQRDVTSDSLTE